MSTPTPSGEKARGIAHLTTVHPPFDVRIFHKECKSIARAGYDVTLIACHDRDEMREGVQIRALPKAHGRLSRMIAGAWAIYRAAIRQNADLYHFHDPELLPVGILLRMRGKMVVYDVHEDVSADVAAKHYIPRAFRRPLAWAVSTLESMSFRLFSGVVAATPTISRRFAVQDQHQVVVSNYPILQEFQTEVPPVWHHRSIAVGYVGVLAKDRCLPEIVRAISLLPEGLHATLKLAGNFSPPALREELAGTNGWDRTCVMGVLDRAGVAGLLADVRAGLVVLKPTPAYLESAPVKMFEYMAAGIPVIASDFPRFREIVEGARCGLLVQPDDPAGIAGAIEFILTHPEEAEEMGKRGQEAVVRKYNWAGEERKLLHLYRMLLGAPCAA
jgi:glycosyltransferase involved in cell wall biosynthesis